MTFFVSFLPLVSSPGLGVLFCLALDYVIFKRDEFWARSSHGTVFKAILDNSVHAIVAGWTWLNVVLLLKESFSAVRVIEVACCAFMGSVIDLDHFIAAGSLSMRVSLSN